MSSYTNTILTIIIINYNTSQLLADCLRSVLNKLSGTFSYEVIVVDNNSKDGSAAMVREYFPSVRLIANKENLGFVGANNQGVAIAEGHYLLFLNSDTIVLDSDMYRLINFFNEHPDVGILTGKVLNADMSFQRPFRRFPTLLSAYIVNTLNLVKRLDTPFSRDYHYSLLDEDHLHEVDWISGAYLFIRANLVTDGKIFDDDIFMFYEDTLVSYQIKKQGYRVFYLPYAPIIHFGGMSTAQAKPRSICYSFESSVHYFLKTIGQKSSVRFYQQAVLLTWSFLDKFFGILSLLPVKKINKKNILFKELINILRQP